MQLTSERFAILAHVVPDPQGWADHAATTIGEEAVEAKVEKYRAEYLAAKDLPGYLTRAERDAASLAAMSLRVPVGVTMRQARLALLQAGLLATVNTVVASMSGAEGDAARIEWEFAATIERQDSLVQSLVGAIGLTEAQLDELFTLAATL